MSLDESDILNKNEKFIEWCNNNQSEISKLEQIIKDNIIKNDFLIYSKNNNKTNYTTLYHKLVLNYGDINILLEDLTDTESNYISSICNYINRNVIKHIHLFGINNISKYNSTTIKFLCENINLKQANTNDDLICLYNSSNLNELLNEKYLDSKTCKSNIKSVEFIGRNYIEVDKFYLYFKPFNFNIDVNINKISVWQYQILINTNFNVIY